MRTEPPLIAVRQLVSLVFITLTMYLYLLDGNMNNILLVVFSYFLIVLFATILPTVKKTYKYGHYLQRFLSILPLLIVPIYPITLKKLTYQELILNIVGLGFISLFLVFEFKENRKILKGIESNIPLENKYFFIELFFYTLSIIAEEFWFKIVMLSTTSIYLGKWTILVGSIIFIHMHYIGRWAKLNYKLNSYIRLFLFITISNVMYYTTESFLFSILAHLIFNGMIFIVLVKRAFFTNKEDFFDDYQ